MTMFTDLLRKARPVALGLSLATMSASGTTAQAVQTETPAIREANAEADARGQHLFELSAVPGMQIAVRRGSRLLWSAAYGSADLELGTALSNEHLLRAGSVSKLFTAAALMRLVQSGQVSLDAQIQDSVPAFSTKPAISLRQLAGHLGGVRHYKDKDELIGLRHYDSVDDSLAIFAADPLENAPGERYRYSTFGFSLLAKAIERSSGQPFTQAVNSLVFAPTGMTASTSDDVRSVVPGRAGGYERDSGTLRNAPFADPSYKWAGGGFLTNAEELTLFGTTLFRPDFLSGDLVAQMLAPQTTSDGKPTGVGIGWRIGTDWKGRRIAHHAGNQEGARSVLLVYPAEQLSVAIMTNSTGEPQLIETSAAAIASAFLDRPASWPLPAGRWQVAGKSSRGDFPGEVRVAKDGGRTIVTLTRFRPLDEFSAAVGRQPPDSLSGSAVATGDGVAVAFVAAPFGYVPVELRWTGGTISGRSLASGTPIEFSFSGPPTR